MPRLEHGKAVSLEQFRVAREALTALTANIPSAFAAVRPVDTRDFDFLFRGLQDDPATCCPNGRRRGTTLWIWAGPCTTQAGLRAAGILAFRRPTPTSGSS